MLCVCWETFYIYWIVLYYYLLLQCKEKIEQQVLKGTEFGGTDNLIKLITSLLN